jgi:hypothetical protein
VNLPVVTITASSSEARVEAQIDELGRLLPVGSHSIVGLGAPIRVGG